MPSKVGHFTVGTGTVGGDGTPTPGSIDGDSPLCEMWCDSLGDCATVEPAVAADAIRMASEILLRLTGYRWRGQCQDVVRPCGPDRRNQCGCATRMPWSTVYDANSADAASMLTAGRWMCGCRMPSRVWMPNGPVVSVDEVLLDGEVVDASHYRLMDQRWLVGVRLADGSSQRWPCCQDLERAETEEGTFQVTYTWGERPPIGGIAAARAYACEIAKSMTGGDDCSLPERVQTITRQGVTIALLDPMTMIDERGMTGVSLTDQWLGSISFARKNRPARVADPLDYAAGGTRHRF